ncbi:T9SS type A sorting domain-containing protein [Flavobacterium sp. LMO8]|uniref:T9SS type A sorting domain-containing protein n=1 Tax=Flavobacterium sp. LMO8 TaxID=2654244 RepID=UPI001396957F|nr:T9SS type A sorting domain-containing protein [Flavobacterium sp. LMO8]
MHTVCRNFPSNATSRATLSFQGAVVTTHPDVFNYPGCVMSATDFEATTATVFPNPFTNSLQIESNTKFKTMELYDVLGKQIFNQNFENQLNTSNLAQGIYLLRLITEDGEVVVKKVVKE